VAATDAAMELLEQVHHDMGEGPCVVAFAEDRVVAVQDLGRELVWDRIAVVVWQLQVRPDLPDAAPGGGKSKREALRVLKRRLVRVVFNLLLADLHQTGLGQPAAPSPAQNPAA
jgi:hypothetical protein